VQQQQQQPPQHSVAIHHNRQQHVCARVCATTAATTATAATKCNLTPAVYRVCVRATCWQARITKTTKHSAAIRTTSSNTPGVCVCQQQHQSQHSAAQRDQQQHTWCVCVPTTSIATQRRAARPAATHLVCVCDDATSSEHHDSAAKSLLGSTASSQEWPGNTWPGFVDRILVRSVFCPRIWSGGRALATLSHPGHEILVGSVSHSWVHHRTSPERDDSVPKSEPEGSGGGGRMLEPAGRTWPPVMVPRRGIGQFRTPDWNPSPVAIPGVTSPKWGIISRSSSESVRLYADAPAAHASCSR
ncbi:hypothetical protein ACLKA7_004928, partial [Drosophila subpalustris]